ncbi:hypothetical protein IWW48_004940 [Coemansia sp. RSA 1200]|nr:hypothetical protein IWW48_004940 [Coemansia sp. RSA 1200]
MSSKGQYSVVKSVVVKTDHNVLGNITISSPSITRTTEYIMKKVHDKTKIKKERIKLYTESRYRKPDSPSVSTTLSRLGKTSTLTLWCNVLKIYFKYGERTVKLYVLIDDKVVQNAKDVLDDLKVKVPASKKIKAKMRTAAYTHFISLPITSTKVQGKVREFQNIAWRKRGLEGMSDSSFVKPSRMHITVGMLRLPTAEEQRAAAECLQSLEKGVREILGEGRALDVRVYGLETMEQDRREARILYAKVEDASESGGRLQSVCEYVRDAFGKAGFIDDGMRELKLHMTVIRASGTRPVVGGGKGDAGQDGKGQSARSRRRRFTVDARELIEEFGQESFGTCRIGQIQIARRFHFTEDGAYADDGCLQLP